MGLLQPASNEIIAIWKGGIAIYGAVIGVVIALAVYSRIKKLSFASLCDLAAFGLLIGQCIGRWGNFVNGEAHGRCNLSAVGHEH